MSIYRQNLINYWRQWYPEWDIPKGFHVHHIRPKSCGGSDHPSNLIALHPDDHVAIHKNRGDRYNKNFYKMIGTHQFGDKNPFYGKKHTKETKQKISLRKKGSKLSEETKKRIKQSAFVGYYITPWGKFNTSREAEIDDVSFASIQRYCKKENDKHVTKQAYVASKYLSKLPFDPIGMTYQELGFGFIPRDEEGVFINKTK